MRRCKQVVLTIFLSLFSISLPAQSAKLVEEMADAARELIESLPVELRAKAAFEFDSDVRLDWHFVPRERKGVSFKELDKQQRALVHEILDAALSRKGLTRANAIIELESVLFELENQSPVRDPGKYYFALFGEPAESGTWGWRFEGHHLSINVTIVDGKVVAGTPMFMGANPAEVREGAKKGMRPLASEEDLGRKLVQALDADQRKTAIFAEKALRDIVTGAHRNIKPLEPAGLALAEMNREQGEMLLNLVKEYLYRYRNEIADEDWKEIREAGLENIHFAWAGSTEAGQAYYYRVQGPTFLIECDNTQNKANHIHTVWRDFKGDFGEDVLKKHYMKSHKKPSK